MASPESLTQKWLRHNVQPYPQPDRVYTDVDSVLRRYPTLRPKSDVYTFDDGRTQLLLCLHGLLPITFRAASYNIPMAVWLTRDYPKHPPIAYVVPTADMLVKAGKYIDVSGRCDIEYIQNWLRKSEGCNILLLFEALQDHFSREPPVYARSPQHTSVETSSRHSPASGLRDRPPPPLPTTQPIPPDSSAAPQKPLPPEVYSAAGARQHQIFPSLSPFPGDAIAASSGPPIPPRPPSDTLPPQYRSFYAAPPVPPNYTIPAGTVTARAPAPYISQPIPQSPIYNPVGSAQYSGRSPTPPPPPPLRPPHTFPIGAPALSQQAQFQPPGPIFQTSTTPILNLLDEDSPETLITNVTPALVPAPPRPPNPELLRLQDQVHHKLTSELSSLNKALALDAERLRAHQADLLAGEPAIRDEMARLEAVRDVCRSVTGRLKGRVQQAELNIAELRRKGDPEVDELICSTTIVHNQLISLVAEDNAIEDTIYHLHRALNLGRIDLERFLRSTRLLAEEQFMKRALIEKIQGGLPVRMSMSSDWMDGR